MKIKKQMKVLNKIKLKKKKIKKKTHIKVCLD